MANGAAVNFAETHELALSSPCPLLNLGVCDREIVSVQSREQPLHPPTAEMLSWLGEAGRGVAAKSIIAHLA